MIPNYEYNCILENIQEFNKEQENFNLKYINNFRKYDNKIIYLLYEKLKIDDCKYEIDPITLTDINDYIQNNSNQDQVEINKIRELVNTVENLSKIQSLKGEEYQWFKQCFIDLLILKINFHNKFFVHINDLCLEYSQIYGIVNKYLYIFFENFIEVYLDYFDVKIQPLTHFLLYMCSWKDLLYIKNMIESDDYFLSLIIAKLPFDLVSCYQFELYDNECTLYYQSFTSDNFTYLKLRQFLTLNILHDFSCLNCKIKSIIPFFLLIESIEDIYHLINDDPHQDEFTCETSLNINFKYEYLKKLEFSKILNIINSNPNHNFLIKDKNVLKLVFAYMITINNFDKNFLNQIKKYKTDDILKELKNETNFKYFSKYKERVEKLESILNNVDECSVCLSIYNLKEIDNKFKCLECQALLGSCNKCLNIVKDLAERNKELLLIKTCSVCLINKIGNFVYCVL